MSKFTKYEDLMPKIQALIAPPDKCNGSTSREKSASDVHSISVKRRGKRYDECDACGERGNVHFCANCPASFHLLCHDPPLSEKEVLNGHWICNSCVYARGNNQLKVTQNSREHHSDSHCSSALMPTATNAFLKRTESTSTNTFQSAQHKNQFPVKKHSQSNRPHGSIIIKKESMDEDNVGSDLDESSETGSVENVPIKMESQDEDDESLRDNVVFSSKPEPEPENRDSPAEDIPGDINGLNMDQVWKILGINKQAKVNQVNESNRKVSSDSGTNVSRKSSDFESTNCIDEAKSKQIHINLTNCDYLLKNRRNKHVKESESAGDAKNKNRKRPAPKSKRKKRPTAIDHAAGIKTVFTHMIKDASKANPKQFTLPFEYVANIDVNLISTEKDSDNFANDLDSRDLLKLPARKCYYCKGTCLVGQMISCDFCPAHFHLNCLNPPLCNIPDVKWMCPLHPHHVLERVMKNPSSITELMSWWSKFSVPIDDEDVKSNFIEKIKSHDKKPKNLPFINSSVKIPDIVKYHYKQPPSRIPPLEELLPPKPTSILNNDFASTKLDVVGRTNFQEPTSSSVISRAATQTNKTAAASQQTPSSSLIKNNSDKKYNLRPYKKVKWRSLLEIASEDEPKSKKSSCNDTKKRDTESIPNSSHTALTKESTSGSNEIHQNGTFSSKPNKKIDPKEANVSWKKIENYIIRDINRNFITGGISITTLSEDIRRILMIQRIKQLTEDLPPSFTPNINPYPLFHPLLKDNINDRLPERPKGKVRAVLCPLSHRPLIYMYGQSLSIGSGFSNDVCLRNYGNCNFISEDHAVIFYDKITNTYELINYSEYNTTVDGVSYTCDISRNRNEKENLTQPTKPDPPAAPESTSKPARKKPASSSSSIPRQVHSKRAASSVKAAEARSTYKRLLNDIDKLVSKSKQEMAAIADEDLNEISKAIKNTPSVTKPDIKIGTRRVQRSKRNATKRKTSEIDDDTSPSKIARTSQPGSSRIEEDTDEVSKSNEDQKIPKPRPNTRPTKRVAKPRRNRTSTRPKKAPRRGRNPTRTKSSNEEVAEEETRCPSDLQTDFSDEEYLLGENFCVNSKLGQCNCQLNGQKFPNGRDDSWERTAQLSHGSLIQFGCIEFIFSIVNYPEPMEQRPYVIPKPKSPPARACEVEEIHQPNVDHSPKDDLTIKLMSILNVLSDKSPENAAESFASRQSYPVSPTSTRSCSPVLLNGHVGIRPESPVDGQIEITG